MYIEKYIEKPRHVEFQIMGDKFGNVVHLGERDCSIQRRHQKVMEESPCEVISPELRKKMGEVAVKAAKAVNYENAGTIEFLLDKDKNFYFMEMNTRVQVEHPVTEMITGTDIIKEQLRIAAGEPISCMDKVPFTPNGHAMEFRINAEDPDMDFRPCPGNITRFEVPAGPGVRVETYIKEGSRILLIMTLWLRNSLCGVMIVKNALPVESAPWLNFISKELKPPFLSTRRF